MARVTHRSQVRGTVGMANAETSEGHRNTDGHWTATFPFLTWEERCQSTGESAKEHQPEAGRLPRRSPTRMAHNSTWGIPLLVPFALGWCGCMGLVRRKNVQTIHGSNWKRFKAMQLLKHSREGCSCRCSLTWWHRETRIEANISRLYHLEAYTVFEVKTLGWVPCRLGNQVSNASRSWVGFLSL